MSSEKVTKAAKTPAKKPLGRPSSFTQAIADTICARIAAGESLRAICSTKGMPNTATVYRWLDNDAYADFREQYARARDAQASLFAAQVIEIADEAPGTYIDEGGNVRVDPGFVNRQRLRIDARKWYAGKVAPKKYGDKVDLNVGGQKDNPLTVLYEQISGKGFAPADDE